MNPTRLPVWRCLLLAALSTFGAIGLGRAAEPPAAPPPPELSAEQARRDLRILERALTELHPGLYRYATPDAMRAAFAAANAAVAQGASRAQLYLLATRLAAAVRCGHTWTNPANQGPAVQAMLDGADKLPVTIRGVRTAAFDEALGGAPGDAPGNAPGDAPDDAADKIAGKAARMRWLVTGSAVPGLAAGAELLAVNGRTPAQITALLLPYLRADGANDGKRIAQIDHDANGGALDRLLPLLQPPPGGVWQLRVRVRERGVDNAIGHTDGTAINTSINTSINTAITGAINNDLSGDSHNSGNGAVNDDGTVRTISARAMTIAERTRRIGAAPPSQAWTLAITGDTALLTLPTFAFWDRGFDGRAFLAKAFATLQAQRVPHLVIDIRANEGGDDALDHALLAHLITQPFNVPGSRRESAYERVPYVLARYLDTWDFGFFDRTGQVQRGPARNWLLPDAPARRIEPVAQPYRGRVVLLVGPQNSSAGYLLARDAKASGAALLMGSTTGGNQRGLNGGQLAWLTLLASGVAVDIPLVANFAPGDAPDGGVLPDVVVDETFHQAAAGIDAGMQAARRLIDGWRRGG